MSENKELDEQEEQQFLTGKEHNLVPIGEYWWDDDYSWHRVLTCKNHPTARYYTKNYWARNLHIIRLPAGDIDRTSTGECICPDTDLVVIVGPNDKKPEAKGTLK